MLYVISTPIGNLSDITFRAIECLKECEYILCEDTRTSRVLLKKYEITTHLVSFHKFNERSREDKVLQDLANGVNVGLISDAGTPGVSDPGYRLLRRCLEEKMGVSPIPGPSSLTALLSICPPKGKVQFLGFAPRKGLPGFVERMIAYDGMSVVFESPHRIRKFLGLLPKECEVVVGRELTKKFEEVLFGSPTEVLSRLSEKVKGELVVGIIPVK